MWDFLLIFQEFFLWFSGFWFLEILGRLWSFRWFWSFDGDFCWTVLWFMAQILLQIITYLSGNYVVFDGIDEIEVLICFNLLMGVIVFGRLEGLVALLVSSKPWWLDVGSGVPCCPLVICSAGVIIICELINYSNKQLLTCTLEGGILDAMGVIKVIYSIVFTMKVFTLLCRCIPKPMHVWITCSMLISNLSYIFKTKPLIKHGKNKVVGHKLGSIKC